MLKINTHSPVHPTTYRPTGGRMNQNFPTKGIKKLKSDSPIKCVAYWWSLFDEVIIAVISETDLWSRLAFIEQEKRDNCHGYCHVVENGKFIG